VVLVVELETLPQQVKVQQVKDSMVALELLTVVAVVVVRAQSVKMEFLMVLAVLLLEVMVVLVLPLQLGHPQHLLEFLTSMLAVEVELLDTLVV
jgi:hypothetical protein